MFALESYLFYEKQIEAINLLLIPLSASRLYFHAKNEWMVVPQISIIIFRLNLFALIKLEISKEWYYISEWIISKIYLL